MEIREFHPYDIDGMGMTLLKDQLGTGNSLTTYAMQLKAQGESFTATVDGVPIACIGLINFWEGRKYVWAFLSDDFCKAKLSLTRAIRRWLRYHHTQGRIETAIQCDNPGAIRWAEGFGFQREGTMRQWMLGQDFYLYARVR